MLWGILLLFCENSNLLSLLCQVRECRKRFRSLYPDLAQSLPDAFFN